MQDQVQDVKNKTDIVSLIGESVKLTKAGKHYKGLCPFHAERTPSFTVSPEMQIYKCFGCSETGDCFTFLEKFEGMEFPEALEFLANRAGITLVKKARTSNASDRDLLIEINELSAKFYHYLLTKHELGKDALQYVVGKRGITKQTIEEFVVGFAPENPTALINFLTKKKYKLEDLERAGVITKFEKNGQIKYLDRFRGRVIFPIMDHRGNTIALAGRILPSDRSEKLAKYINSPETPIYHKSATLFGLNLARGFIKKSGWVVIVEGELDMISSWQIGIKNIVAIKGSALTEEQVTLLSRLCKRVVLALDSDLAGNAAARRGITIAQEKDLTVEVMQADSEYKDPDEFARGNPDGFKHALKNATGVWDFIIQSIISKYEIETGEGKASASRELVPLLGSIQDSIVQAHYVNLVAQKLRVPTEAVIAQLTRVKQGQKTQNITDVAQKKEIKSLKREELLERDIFVFACALDPKKLLDDPINRIIQTPLYVQLKQGLAEYFKTHTEFDAGEVKSSLAPELQEGFAEVILLANTEDTQSTLERELEKSIRELVILRAKIRLQELTNLMAQFEEEEDVAKLNILQEEFKLLSQEIMKNRA